MGKLFGWAFNTFFGGSYVKLFAILAVVGLVAGAIIRTVSWIDGLETRAVNAERVAAEQTAETVKAKAALDQLAGIHASTVKDLERTRVSLAESQKAAEKYRDDVKWMRIRLDQLRGKLANEADGPLAPVLRAALIGLCDELANAGNPCQSVGDANPADRP